MSQYGTITDEEFTNLVKESFSVSEVLRKQGKKCKGGYHRTVKNRILKLKLDTSHFKGFGWSKGLKRNNVKKDIQLYLTNQLYRESHYLKVRLIEEGFFERKCYTCNNTEWNGKPIPVELDHINGNRLDNRLENLSIICPNCHAQTPTYKARNRKDVAQQSYCGCGQIKTIKAKRCQNCVMAQISRCLCGQIKLSRQMRCSECRKTWFRSSKINWPNKEELSKLVWEIPMWKLCKDLGISDRAISKRCKKLGIEIPKRGYWLSKNKLRPTGIEPA